MKLHLAIFLGVTLGISVHTIVWAAPSPEQQQQLDQCQIMASGTLQFANYRDKGMSKQDAFKAVTKGESTYEAGSPLDQMEQAAYSHPDYQPETVTAYFYGECVLNALGILTPEIDAQLKANAEFCQHDHSGKPDELRSCINDKTAAIISANGAKNKDANAGVAPQVVPVQPPAGMPVKDMSDAEYEAYFKCPESYDSADKAQAAVKEYGDWAITHHPMWTVNQLVAYRYQLLVHHSCTKTLDYIRTHNGN